MVGETLPIVQQPIPAQIPAVLHTVLYLFSFFWHEEKGVS